MRKEMKKKRKFFLRDFLRKLEMPITKRNQQVLLQLVNKVE
jgi:hypothetical protein